MATGNGNGDMRREIAERMRGPFDVCERPGHMYIIGTLFGMQVCATNEMELLDDCDEFTPYICCHLIGAENHGDIPMYYLE